MIFENVKFRFDAPFVSEGISEEKNTRKIKGTMMVHSVENRNQRIYTKEAFDNTRFEGDTIGLNHSEDVTDNVGLFVPKKMESGFDFSAKLFDTGKHPYITDMVDKGLLKFVSIEAIADKIREDEGNAIIDGGLTITGLGIVKTGGFKEAKFAVAEAFEEMKHMMKKPDMMMKPKDMPMQDCGDDMKDENGNCPADTMSDEEMLSIIDSTDEAGFSKDKPGQGGRFAACRDKVMGRKNPRTGNSYTSDEADKICASIGRKKYGDKKFAGMGKEKIGDVMEEQKKEEVSEAKENKEIKELKEKIDSQSKALETTVKSFEELKAEMKKTQEKSKGIIASEETSKRLKIVKEASLEPNSHGRKDLYTKEFVY